VDGRALAGIDITGAESSVVSLKNPIQRIARHMRVLPAHGAIRFDPLAEFNGRRLLGPEPLPLFADGVPRLAEPAAVQKEGT
jgi:hypothetical protein